MHQQQLLADNALQKSSPSVNDMTIKTLSLLLDILRIKLSF